MKTLHLNLKGKWFRMIASGQKTEEYREIKSYWTTRLLGKKFDAVRFRNGYAKDAPEILVELQWIKVRTGIEQWGAAPGVEYYTLKLGKILEVSL